MIGRFQRPSKVVHGKNVFQKFRFLEITDAPGLPRGIKLMRQRVRPRIEIVIVAGFIDTHAPQNDGGMVPVAPDHSPHIVHRDVLPAGIADVLPAGNLFQLQQPDLIAGIQKVP